MRVRVRVIPRAKKFRVQQTPQGLKVHLTEPAIANKANKKLIKVLAEYYQTKDYKIKLVKGQTKRDKLVEILF